MRAAAGLVLAALALGACSPGLPKGVSKDKLNAAISDAIGDPNTCLLIGQQGSGKVVYRYNTHTTCGRGLPACERPVTQTVDDLLKSTAKDGRSHAASCNTTADASRGVGWASGVIAGKGLVYAAVMEGNRALPGMLIAEKAEGALKDAGL